MVPAGDDKPRPGRHGQAKLPPCTEAPLVQSQAVSRIDLILLICESSQLGPSKFPWTGHVQRGSGVSAAATLPTTPPNRASRASRACQSSASELYCFGRPVRPAPFDR